MARPIAFFTGRGPQKGKSKLLFLWSPDIKMWSFGGPQVEEVPSFTWPVNVDQVLITRLPIHYMLPNLHLQPDILTDEMLYLKLPLQVGKDADSLVTSGQQACMEHHHQEGHAARSYSGGDFQRSTLTSTLSPAVATSRRIRALVLTLKTTLQA